MKLIIIIEKSKYICHEFELHLAFKFENLINYYRKNIECR